MDPIMLKTAHSVAHINSRLFLSQPNYRRHPSSEYLISKREY